MSSRVRLLLCLLALTLVSAACGGEPPSKEMQDAQSAIDSARSAGAERYSAEELAAAQQALQHARDAVAQRDFRLALNHALDSRERAQTAAADAAGKRAAARAEAERALASARRAVDAAAARIQSAETGRAGAGATISREVLTTAQQHLQEASTAFGQDDYVRSSTEIATALQALASVSADLSQTAPSGPRRRRP